MKGSPVYVVDADFIVPVVMRVCIGYNLLVEPRDAGIIDLRCPGADIIVACSRINRRTLMAVVVRGISVACTPFLHYKLFASIFGLIDV